MKLGIRGKLFFASLLLITVSIAVADAFVARLLDEELSRKATAELFVRLALVEREVSAAGYAPEAVDLWDELSDELGRRAEGRVTVIRLDGKVIGDTDLDGAALREVESHASRPEIVEALEHGRGATVRFSGSVRRRLVYVAVPFTIRGQRAGVVRLAEPLTDVDRAVEKFRRMVGIASIIALVVSVFMATLAAELMSRSVRSLTGTARRMADGDLGARTRAAGTDEIAELGKALDYLAGGLARALSELRTERDLLSRVLDRMKEGVLLLDRQGRVALANPALRELLLLQGEVVGKSPLELARNADLKQLLDDARRSGQPMTAELGLGTVRPRRVLVSASTLPATDDHPGGQLVVFVDVTDVRRLESLRRDFVANASHELRTPIAAIRSAAETVRVALGDYQGPALGFLEIIDRQGERLQRLVDDLLDLSRIESRQFSFRLEPLHPREIVSHIASLLLERAERRGVRIENEVDPDVVVLADLRAVEQVLTNLLENAVKYGREGGVVRATAEVGSRSVHLAVTDDGPGIPAVHLPRLFERFYRVDAGRSRDMGGTGLGLAIVKHLVEGMNGAIVVESTEGEGTTFSVTLPRGDA